MSMSCVLKGKRMNCYKCKEKILGKDAVKHGLHLTCFMDWFGLPSDMDFSNLIIKQFSSKDTVFDNDFKEINSSFFHGKFKKYSALLNDISYILKVEDRGFADLPAAEFLSNKIAENLQIPTPQFYFIQLENNIDAFVSKNFMSSYGTANLEHLYHFFKKGEKFNCENIIRILKEKTGRYKDIQRFIELCLFDSFIGNHDRHGRNLGLILTAKGYQLAPFYDNPSYLAIEEPALLGAMLDPRGKIATSVSNEPTMKDYVHEFKEKGFHDTILDFKKKIKMSEIQDLINDSFISDMRKQAFSRLIERRYKELENEI